MKLRILLRWTLAAALALLAVGAVDLLAIDQTLLTPYAEQHPSSGPLRHPATGVAYVKDQATGEAFTVLQGDRVVHLDETTGRADPATQIRNVRLVPGRVLVMHEPLSPLYAFWMPIAPARLARLLPALVFCALLLILVIRKETLPDAVWLVALPVFAVLIRASFAWIRTPLGSMGRQFLTYENEEVLYDAPKVTHVLEFLRTYPAGMENLSLHGSHFPPGYILLLKGVAIAAGHESIAAIKAGVGIYGWTVLVLGALAVIPLFLLARDVFGKRAALFASALFLLAPNSVAFGAVSLDAVFATAALWTIWAFRHGLRGSTAHAVLAGALVVLTTFLSFSGLVLGLFLALFAAFHRDDTRRHVLRSAAFTLAGAVLAAGALYALGFDFAACFAKARVLEARLMDGAAAQRGTSLSALRGYLSWANLGAFFLGSGVALLGAWLLSVVTAARSLRRGAPGGPFALALLVVLLVAGIGIYHMETERIWLCWTGILVLSVGGLLGSLRDPSEASRALCLIALPLVLQTAVSEALLLTLW